MKFNNRNIHLSASAKIGKNVRIGDNTIIYDNVTIGDNTIICNDCVIGEPTNAFYHDKNYKNEATIIGPNSLIRSHTIIYSGCNLGAGLNTGHRVTIRENTCTGQECLISTLVDIQGNCSIGNFSRLYSNVHVGQLTKIGNYVFVFPYSIFTNDPLPPSNNLKGASVDDYSIIAVHSVILPGISIGKHTLIAANSTVTRNVNDFTMVAGNPAKPIKDIREQINKLTGKSHYPWPYFFDRGMPWEGKDYDKWLTKNP